MKKPAIDLVYSVAEIISLFEKTRSIESFLKTTVSLIAEHMVTDLCSIYLIDQESGNLILQASTGLKPAAVGTLSLAPGEGITGKALKELRPSIPVSNRFRTSTRNPTNPSWLCRSCTVCGALG